MNAIEITGLKKQYKDFELGPIDLALPSGSIIGLVGENGAGKSTTIKLIMNAISKNEGKINVLSVDNESTEFTSVKNDIGVVLDEAYYPEVMSAKNVARVMMKTYKNWDNELYFSYLKRFSLPLDKAFKDYSRGMKMKLAIAVALSHKAKLLILDEATSGLDPMVRDEILDLFNEFTREEDHSILLSSHIVSDLEKICDYIAFIHKGKLLLCEEKDRLLEEYALIRVSEQTLSSLSKSAVLGVKRGNYGTEALVLRSNVPSSLTFERITLEDIILFLAKGEKSL